MMKMKMFAMAATVVGGLGLATAASAAPLPAAPGLADGAAVETVRFGCGPGFAPNRFGVCRPVARPFVVGPRRVFGPRYGYGRRYGYGPRPFRRF